MRRSLNAVHLEYLLTAVTADNHTLTHSLSPSIDTLDSEGVFPYLLPIPKDQGNSRFKYGQENGLQNPI